MKQHRFFIEQELQNTDEVILTDRDVIHQMKDVLRLRVGDPVILLDGTGTVFHGRVKILLKKESIISKEKIKKVSRKNEMRVHLYASLIKKDKFEWVLQKATELGVSEITPIISERTEKLHINYERAHKIIREAAEQSERIDLPVLHETVTLQGAVENCETYMVALHMDGAMLPVAQLRETGDVALFVGPEGGWGETDMKQFEQHNVPVCSLGETVLRAETASVAVLSLLLLG